MSLIVMKFGGTSVGDSDRIKNAAAKVAAEIKRGHQVAVVVSAMAGVTDQLITLCRAISPHYDAREYDAVVATGEQVSAGLMALALHQRGLNARSWQGWQMPLITDTTHGKARIVDIQTDALHTALAQGEVAVITGFQGITPDKRVTTLGRGGGDTSAVAIAIALKADRCDIYTDVDGVYTTDPRVVSKARKMNRVSYEEMLELASLGAKVLQVRSVEMAMRYQMPLQVLSTFANDIGSDLPGTLVCQEKDITGEEKMENNPVTGIACSKDQTRITLANVPDRPGVVAAIFGPLARAGIGIDMIVQSGSGDSKRADTTLTVIKSEAERAVKVLHDERAKIGFETLVTTSGVTKISLVGAGMRSQTGVAAKMFETLAEKGINILVIETSEINISVLIAEEYTELALRSLHSAYGLDAV